MVMFTSNNKTRTAGSSLFCSWKTNFTQILITQATLPFTICAPITQSTCPFTCQLSKKETPSSIWKANLVTHLWTWLESTVAKITSKCSWKKAPSIMATLTTGRSKEETFTTGLEMWTSTKSSWFTGLLITTCLKCWCSFINKEQTCRKRTLMIFPPSTWLWLTRVMEALKYWFNWVWDRKRSWSSSQSRNQ